MMIAPSRFLSVFRWRMRASTIISTPNIAIPARDQVESTNNQNPIAYPSWVFMGFFLRNPRAKNGKNATIQNPKLIGLSKRNWFLTYPLLMRV